MPLRRKLLLVGVSFLVATLAALYLYFTIPIDKISGHQWSETQERAIRVGILVVVAYGTWLFTAFQILFRMSGPKADAQK